MVLESSKNTGKSQYFTITFKINVIIVAKCPNEPSTSNAVVCQESIIETTSSEDEDQVLPDSDSSVDEDIDSDESCDLMEETDKLESMTLEECVRFWALQTNQDHHSINLISEIINKKTNGKLPRDARTLLQTSREKPLIENKAGGQYWYYKYATMLD